MTPKKSPRNHKGSLPGKCLVESCTSRRGYRLPAGGSLLQEWLTALKLEPGLKPSSKLVICAKHFAPVAFQPSQQSNGTIHLMLTDEAVPSVFPATKKNTRPSSGCPTDVSSPSRIQNAADVDVTILSSDEESTATPSRETRKRKNVAEGQVKKKRKRKGKNSSQSESTTDDEDTPQTLVCKDEDDVYSDDSDVILCEKPVDTVDLTSQLSSPERDSPVNGKSFDDDDGNDSDCQIVGEVITLNSDEEDEEEITYTMPLTPVDIDLDMYSSNSEDESVPGTKGGTCTQAKDDKDGSDSSSFDSSITFTTSPTSLTPYAARTTDFSWDVNIANGPRTESSSSDEETADNDESTVPPDDFVNLESESSISALENLSNNDIPCKADKSVESSENPVKDKEDSKAEDLEVNDGRPIAETIDNIDKNGEEVNSGAVEIPKTADSIEEGFNASNSEYPNGRANSLEWEQTDSAEKSTNSAIVKADLLNGMDPEEKTSSTEPSSDTRLDDQTSNVEAVDASPLISIDNSEVPNSVKNPVANAESSVPLDASNSLDASKDELNVPCDSGTDKQRMNESNLDELYASASGNTSISHIVDSTGESSVFTIPNGNGCSKVDTLFYDTIQLEDFQNPTDSPLKVRSRLSSPIELEPQLNLYSAGPPNEETDVKPTSFSVDSKKIDAPTELTKNVIDSNSSACESCEVIPSAQKNIDLTIDSTKVSADNNSMGIN